MLTRMQDDCALSSSDDHAFEHRNTLGKLLGDGRIRGWLVHTDSALVRWGGRVCRHGEWEFDMHSPAMQTSLSLAEGKQVHVFVTVSPAEMGAVVGQTFAVRSGFKPKPLSQPHRVLSGVPSALSHRDKRLLARQIHLQDLQWCFGKKADAKELPVSTKSCYDKEANATVVWTQRPFSSDLTLYTILSRQ